MKKLALLIISYDKYLHLAEINYKSILKYWPDNDFDIYYMSNYLKFSKNYKGVSCIKVGKDISWSLSLKTALNKLQKDYEFVLTFIDDIILTKKVNNSEVKLVLNRFYETNGDCIKLIKKPKPNTYYNKYFGEISHNAPYRATVVFTFWKISSLLNILSDEESAWDFEKNAVKRLKKKNKFFSVYTSKFKFFNIVIKGKYQLRFKKIIKDLSVDVSVLPEYEYFNIYDVFKRQYLKIRHKLFMTFTNIFKNYE